MEEEILKGEILHGFESAFEGNGNNKHY